MNNIISQLIQDGYMCKHLKDKREMFDSLQRYLSTGGQSSWDGLVKLCDELGKEKGQPGDKWFHCKSPNYPLASREFIALVRNGVIISTIMLRMS